MPSIIVKIRHTYKYFLIYGREDTCIKMSVYHLYYSNVDDEDELLYGDTDTSVFSSSMDTSQTEVKRLGEFLMNFIDRFNYFVRKLRLTKKNICDWPVARHSFVPVFFFKWSNASQPNLPNLPIDVKCPEYA